MSDPTTVDGLTIGPGADLRGADLREANLRGADLREADIERTCLVDAGQDARGYRFVGVPTGDGPRVLAGCRWFTVNEALDHWGQNPDATARVMLIDKLMGEG